MANPVITLNEDPSIYSLIPAKGGDTSIHDEINQTSFLSNAIGERKLLEMKLNVDTGLNGYTFYYNPAMDIANGLLYPSLNYRPLYGYKVSFPAAPVPGEVYDMECFSAIAGTEPLLNNYKVVLECVDATNFNLYHYYYEIYDVDNFMNSSLEDNHSKLLKEKKNSPSELTVAGPSKFTEAKRNFVPYIFVEKNSNVNEKGYYTTQMRYLSGFYNKGTQNSDPYFTTPLFTLQRNAAAVTNLSIVNDTKLTFSVDCPHSILDKVLIWMIRTDTNDNTVDFLTNYDYSHIDCVTTGGVATIDNKLKAPATGVTGGGVTKTVDVMIDKTKLNFFEKYRFVAVCYKTTESYESGGYEVTSFISDEFTVDDYPTWTGDEADFTGSMYDYNNRFLGNDLTCVIEERIKSKLEIDHTNFAAEILSRLGITLANSDLRRYLTQLDITIYTEVDDGNGTVTRQIYDRQTSYRAGMSYSYSAVQNATANFGTTGTTLAYTWRNRYEPHIPNIETQINGIALPTPTETQDWAGKVLFVEWGLHFYYDDYAAPFEDVVKFIQRIRPQDYSANNVFRIETQDADEDANEFFCIEDGELCLKAKHVMAGEAEYNLIVTIEPSPGNANTVEEAEAYTDQLPQLTTPKITSEAILYTNGARDGLFCVDVSLLNPNTTYKISAMRKQVAP